MSEKKPCWMVVGTRVNGKFIVIKGFYDRNDAEKAAITGMGSGDWSAATVAYAVIGWEMSKSFFECTQTSTYGNEERHE